MLTTYDDRAPTDTRQPSLTYLPGLDGLRALAVIAVLAYHAEVSWLPGGFLGVELFFVISGYIITAILLNERRRRGSISLRRFYLRRARRLLPALVACVVVTLFVAFLLVPDEVRSLRDDVLASLGYVSNWNLVFSDVPYFETFGRPSLFLHIWSLGVEEQFYLLWPLLLIAALALGGRRAAGVVAVVGIVASAVWMAVLVDPRDPSRVYYGTDTRAAGFLLGAALAMCWAPGRLQPWLVRSSRRLLNMIGTVAIVAVGAAMVLISEFDVGLYQGGFLVVSLLSVVAIAVAVHPGTHVSRVLGIAPLVWIGLRSYGIYLWHFPIFMLTRPGFDVVDQPLLVNTLPGGGDVGGGRALVPAHRDADPQRRARSHVEPRSRRHQGSGDRARRRLRRPVAGHGRGARDPGPAERSLGAGLGFRTVGDAGRGLARRDRRGHADHGADHDRGGRRRPRRRPVRRS